MTSDLRIYYLVQIWLFGPFFLIGFTSARVVLHIICIEMSCIPSLAKAVSSLIRGHLSLNHGHPIKYKVVGSLLGYFLLIPCPWGIWEF